MQSGTTGINTLRIYSPAKQAVGPRPPGRVHPEVCPRTRAGPRRVSGEPHDDAPPAPEDDRLRDRAGLPRPRSSTTPPPTASPGPGWTRSATVPGAAGRGEAGPAQARRPGPASRLIDRPIALRAPMLAPAGLDPKGLTGPGYRPVPPRPGRVLLRYGGRVSGGPSSSGRRPPGAPRLSRPTPVTQRLKRESCPPRRGRRSKRRRCRRRRSGGSARGCPRGAGTAARRGAKSLSGGTSQRARSSRLPSGGSRSASVRFAEASRVKVMIAIGRRVVHDPGRPSHARRPVGAGDALPQPSV